jgi:hypothetical protein
MVNRVVRIYAAPGYRQRALVAEGTVDPSGDLSVEYRPEINTGLSAEYDGDEGYTSQVASTEAWVRLLVSAKLRHNYGVSGRYKLYHLGSRLRAVAFVTPELSGTAAAFPIQRLGRSGAWTPFDVDHTVTNKYGRASVDYLVGRRGSYRLRVMVYREDYVHGRTAWKYFRVTR